MININEELGYLVSLSTKSHFYQLMVKKMARFRFMENDRATEHTNHWIVHREECFQVAE